MHLPVFKLDRREPAENRDGNLELAAGGIDLVDAAVQVHEGSVVDLHLLADSSDALKRNRGRRGLDILNEMQEEPSLRIEIFSSYTAVRSEEPVDAKLVQLAK